MYPRRGTAVTNKKTATDKFCVKFSRKAGSAMLFYDSATKYMDLLSICNNATLGEEEE